MVGDFVGGVGAARDYDHYRQLLGLDRLEIVQRRDDRENGYYDEGGPQWEGLKVPGESLRAVAADYYIQFDWGSSMREGEGAGHWYLAVGTRSIIGGPYSNKRYGGCKMIFETL